MTTYPITFTRELVTPELAKYYLDNHPLNRRPKQKVVDLYAADMATGRWKTETAEPIKIAEDGSLMDGQHRLLAIIKSKTPIYLYIAKNVPLDSFDVLDTGTVRNSSDVFKIKGIPNENIIPSIIGMYNVLRVEGQNPIGVQKNKKGTNATILKQYEQDPDYWQEISRATYRWYNDFSKVLSPSYVGGVYAFLLDKNNELADSFMSQVCSGADIENDVILHLRNKLLSDKLSLRKMGMDLKLALILKAWNVFIEKKRITLLKWAPIREPFPIAKHKG